MQWIAGTESEVRFPESPGSFLRELEARDCRYGGVLWSEVRDLRSRLKAYHTRLLRDFALGWRVVGFTARGEPTQRLGPFSPPTAARAHGSAPLGLYLVSAPALKEVLRNGYEGDLAMHLHHNLSRFGLVFCDPGLELELSSNRHRDYHYLPPSRWQVMKTVASALLSRRFPT